MVIGVLPSSVENRVNRVHIIPWITGINQKHQRISWIALPSEFCPIFIMKMVKIFARLTIISSSWEGYIALTHASCMLEGVWCSLPVVCIAAEMYRGLFQ